LSEQSEFWADWVTIWQSEMAALAADREMQEALQRAIDLWAAQANLLATASDEAGSTGAAATARAAPDLAASRERAPSQPQPGGD
jgi:hypothetical protein